MATQSLYRRFRPRRFSELYGQDHVVRALRNAVINGREGQAYMFSGPRGTGKTTTARILAKVLNCESAREGEPCCECPSCLAVEAGNSYDVLELDAASNNGVAEIRDLIESASLASPGRHRVFILDEVHMLTKGAEAALLKTLEEPPAHVVFVLATTDPQKVSETIRSRVQHLQFHLIAVATLEKYVRHVISESGFEVSDESVDLVLRQGGGSARDTLSALEIVVSGGGEPETIHTVDEVLDALAARDKGRVLAAVAGAVQLGREPRAFAEDILRALRDSFLAVLAPELVLLPAEHVTALAERARQLGNRTIVRAMEVIGTVLVEMRHAPDARLLLEVAMMRLTAGELDDSTDALLGRVAALEEKVGRLAAQGGAALAPAPVDPSTGRARIGGRASIHTDTTDPVGRPPAPAGAAPPPSVPAASDDVPAAVDPARVWPQIVESLSPLAKAFFKPATVESVEGRTVTVRLPQFTPLDRADRHRATLVDAVRKACGAKFDVALVNDGSGAIERPAPQPANLAEQVAADADAPVAPEDILGEVDEHATLQMFRQHFPEGKVEDSPPPGRGR